MPRMEDGAEEMAEKQQTYSWNTEKQHRRLGEVLIRREKIRESMEEVSGMLRVLGNHREVLLDVLRIHSGGLDIEMDGQMSPCNVKPCGVIIDGPLHVRGERHLLMMYNLGSLPALNMKAFYSSRHVYPVGYMSKRVYRRHGANIDGKEMLIYKCMIRNVGNKPEFEVSDGCGMCIKGKASDVFGRFKSLFTAGIGFQSLQEFFGLLNPDVRRFLSELDGYNELQAEVQLGTKNSSV